MRSDTAINFGVYGAPEKLMRAMLLQVLYSVRSERQLVEQISYNLLFRWFVGLSIEDTAFGLGC